MYVSEILKSKYLQLNYSHEGRDGTLEKKLCNLRHCRVLLFLFVEISKPLIKETGGNWISNKEGDPVTS